MSDVSDTQWRFGPDDGDLLIRTGVGGRAAKMGHRLTLVLGEWQATVDWAGDEPVAVDFTVAVDSLQVVRGDGGVKALSGPEKNLVRSNALRSLDAGDFPTIRFAADTIDQTGDGYRLPGTLQIHGRPRDQVVEVQITDAGTQWQLSSNTAVRQSDFGVRPYSLLMGALQVADEVLVSWHARRAKDR